jgi:hypothetical protein
VFKQVCASSSAFKKKQDTNRASKAAHKAKHPLLRDAPGAAKDSSATRALVRHAALTGPGEAAPVTEVNDDVRIAHEPLAPPLEASVSAGSAATVQVGPRAVPAMTARTEPGCSELQLEADGVVEQASEPLPEPGMDNVGAPVEADGGCSECPWEVVARWSTKPVNNELKVIITRSNLWHSYVAWPFPLAFAAVGEERAECKGS